MRIKKMFPLFLIIFAIFPIAFFVWRDFFAKTENKPITIPLTAKNITKPAIAKNFFLTTPVSILMYHHIRPYLKNSNDVLTVSPENFETQLKWLVENEFQTIQPADLFNLSPTIKKPIILTFDDGYQDAYDYAFPILKKYNFQGTFYLTSNWIDTPGSLTKKEILEMEEYNMNFGSHTLSHQDLPTISPARARQEIIDSKKNLEQKTEKAVIDFCYPGGGVSTDVENIVFKAGYKTATTTISDTNIGNTDPFKLKRFTITNDTNFEDFPALKNIQ